ncbi:MAG: glutamate synthase subunit beta [Planctomycetota bacterium]
MGKPTGFIEHGREDVGHRPVDQRTGDWLEVDVPLPLEAMLTQASRCMDCGIPFCHGVGCPLANRVPEFSDLVYQGRWREAAELLHATNNFPEITGRVCPAPCEAACTLSINDDPVLIRHIEYQVAEKAFEEGWIEPLRPKAMTGFNVAVTGSGPAGLAAAQQLARAGHNVVVFETSDRIGGLLRYGIPDFKLDKRILDRRLEQLKAEGVVFQPGVVVGEDISARYLRRTYDAVCITAGATVPRDLAVPGRGFENVHFAMTFLEQQNRINAGDEVPANERISVKDKVVVVIGGGDTGSDCVGTSIRQKAKEVHQFEILPQPPERRADGDLWPDWPEILRTSSSHEEGCQRRWCVLTKKLTGRGVRAEQLHAVEVNWEWDRHGKWTMAELPATKFSMDVDMVLLAMGFLHTAHSGIVSQFGLALDETGNVVARNYHTSEEGVFVAGDAAEGASLVVRAIASGRNAAAAIDGWLRSRQT